MKMTVDVDCTPEEARRFIGLPDLAPVHEAYTDRLKRLVEEGITPDVVQAMVKSWSPMGDVGLSMWRQMFEQIGKLGDK